MRDVMTYICQFCELICERYVLGATLLQVDPLEAPTNISEIFLDRDQCLAEFVYCLGGVFEALGLRLIAT